jgi:hypothetical protein
MEKIELEKVGHKKRPLLFLGFMVLFVSLVGLHNYNQYYILKDYPVYALTPCDPSVHSCFLIDEELAFFSTQAGPYSKVEIHASDAPACLDEHTCVDFSCEGMGASCSMTFCSEETKEEGEYCSYEI